MIKLLGIGFFLTFFAVALFFFFSKSKHADQEIRRKRDKRKKVLSSLFILYLAIMAWFMFFFRSGPKVLTKDELMELVEERIEPESGEWHYVGTIEDYDHFHYRDRKFYAMGYMVNKGEIELKNRFEGIGEEEQWVLMPWGPNNEN